MTCTMNHQFLFGPGDSLTIPSGSTLIVPTVLNDYALINQGTLTNDGTIRVNNGPNSYGVRNDGTLDNYGLIDLANNGNTGLWNNGGTINNYGTVLLENSEDPVHLTNTAALSNGGIFNNLGCGGLAGNYVYLPSIYYTPILTSAIYFGTSISPSTTCTGVPEFPGGLVLLFALLVPALLVLEKTMLAPRRIRV